MKWIRMDSIFVIVMDMFIVNPEVFQMLNKSPCWRKSNIYITITAE